MATAGWLVAAGVITAGLYGLYRFTGRGVQGSPVVTVQTGLDTPGCPVKHITPPGVVLM